MAKITQCKTCSSEIATNAKTCPTCGAKNSKKIYKRWWFWALIIVIFISAIGGEESNLDMSNKVDISANEQVENDSPKVEEVVEKQEVEKEEVVEEEVVEEEKIPTEYKSALKKAEIYSDTMYMSKKGIYDQLTSEYGEQFSEEAAQYAIDNVEADWKENALKES